MNQHKVILLLIICVAFGNARQNFYLTSNTGLEYEEGYFYSVPSETSQFYFDDTTNTLVTKGNAVIYSLGLFNSFCDLPIYDDIKSQTTTETSSADLQRESAFIVILNNGEGSLVRIWVTTAEKGAVSIAVDSVGPNTKVESQTCVPVIYRISPDEGLAQGTDVVLHGFNFGLNEDEIFVSIGSTACQNIKLLTDETLVKCRAAGIGRSVPVVITVGTKQNTNSIMFKFGGCKKRCPIGQITDVKCTKCISPMPYAGDVSGNTRAEGHYHEEKRSVRANAEFEELRRDPMYRELNQRKIQNEQSIREEFKRSHTAAHTGKATDMKTLSYAFTSLLAQANEDGDVNFNDAFATNYLNNDALRLLKLPKFSVGDFHVDLVCQARTVEDPVTHEHQMKFFGAYSEEPNSKTLSVISIDVVRDVAKWVPVGVDGNGTTIYKLNV